MQVPLGRERWLLGLVLAGLLSFHWLTFRHGHGWGGDFAMYLAHAENLVEGRPYADTGYVVNPHRPRLGPLMYPPGWPALLALPIAAFDVDFDVRPVEGLELLKGWLLALFMAYLVFVWLVARSRAGPTGFAGATLVLLAVGLNPYHWDEKSALLSEIPFCLFLYAALHFADRLTGDPAPAGARWEPGDRGPARSGWRTAGLVLATGGLLYLAYATRAVALTAFAAVVGTDLIRRRRVKLATLAALAIAVPLVLLQNQVFDVLSGYGAGVRAGMETVPGAGSGAGSKLIGMAQNSLHNLPRMPMYLAWAWGGGLPQVLDQVLSGLFFAAAAVGLVAVLRERVGVTEVFCLVYVGGLSLLPASYVDLRRLIPVLPLFFLYAVRGFGALASLRPPALPQLARASALVLLAAGYLGSYRGLEHGTLSEGVHTPDARELFDVVRAAAGPDDLCLFFKPRVLAHFADCRAAGFWETDRPAELMRQADELGATLLVAGPGSEEDAPLRAVAASFPERLEERWSNGHFALYAIRPAAPGR